MRKKILTIITCVIIIAAVFGMFLLTLQKPSAEVKKIKYGEVNYHIEPITDFIKPDSLVLKVTLNIHNPNLIGAFIDKVDADVYYNEEYLGKVDDEVNREIKANGDTLITVEFEMTTPPTQLTDPADIRVVGDAYISKWFLSHKVGFDKTKTVALLE